MAVAVVVEVLGAMEAVGVMEEVGVEMLLGPVETKTQRLLDIGRKRIRGPERTITAEIREPGKWREEVAWPAELL
jgi:hypothetical protein